METNPHPLKHARLHEKNICMGIYKYKMLLGCDETNN